MSKIENNDWKLDNKLWKCSTPGCPWNKGIPLPGPQHCVFCKEEMILETENNWLKKIAEDNDLWAKNEKKEWPGIIAFEYERLREYCANANAYGVMLCLKDNLEILLKFETLLAYAWADKHCGDEFRKKTVSQITVPNPSFGTWRELACLIIKDLNKVGIDLPEEIPLNKVKTLYTNDKRNLVNWRNEKIGHGVLGFEEDDEFKKDITEKLGWYLDIIKALDPFLKKQKLFLRYHNGGEAPLTGADHARGALSGGEVCIRLSDGQTCEDLVLDPFICLQNDHIINTAANQFGIYYFENQKKRTLSDFQAYATGYWSKTTGGHFAMLRSLLDDNGLAMDDSADDRFKDENGYNALDVSSIVDEYVSQDEIIEWLRACVDQYDKGCFMLEMDRGMGKSVFAQKLNLLFEHPIYINGEFDVRTYHLGRLQSGGESDMINYIEQLWDRDYEGRRYNGIKKVSDFINEGYDKADAFARYLGDVLLCRKHTSKGSKIMLVFDGVDELVNDLIRNYIPSSDLLSEGVYILFTSRNPDTEKLEAGIASYIRSLNVEETLVIKRNDNSNIQFLDRFISNTNLKSIDENYKKKLCEKAEYRVLYLGLLCRMVENGVVLEDIGNAEIIVRKYLELLGSRYGEREFIRVKEILEILSVLGEKEFLTLEIIGALSTENKVTLRLIGLMADLMPLVNVEREAVGNCYRLANDDIAQEMLSLVHETDSVIKGLVDFAMASMTETECPKKDSAEEVICKHVTELALMLPEKTAAMGEEREAVLLLLCEKSDKAVAFAEEKLYARWISLQYQIQRMYMLENDYGQDDEKTLGCQSLVAKNYDNLGEYQEAKELYERVLERQSILLADDDEAKLCTMNNLGVEYSHTGDHKSAKELFKKVYDIRALSLGAEAEETLIAYSNYAKELGFLDESKEALKIHEEIFEIRKKEYGLNNNLTMISLLAIADAYFQLGNNIKARELIDLGMRVSEETKDISLENEINLYSLLANIYERMGDAAEASKIIMPFANEIEKEFGYSHPFTASMMNARAVCCFYQQDYNTARVILERVISEYVEKREVRRPEDGEYYCNLATVYTYLEDYENAKENCQKALRVHQKVYGNEHTRTAASYYALAGILMNEKNNQEAQEMVEKAYAIFEKKKQMNNPVALRCLIRLGLLSAGRGDNISAKNKFEQAYDGLKKNNNKEDQEAALNALGCWARAEISLNNKTKAIHLYEKLYRERLKSYDKDDETTVWLAGLIKRLKAKR